MNKFKIRDIITTEMKITQIFTPCNEYAYTM